MSFGVRIPEHQQHSIKKLISFSSRKKILSLKKYTEHLLILQSLFNARRRQFVAPVLQRTWLSVLYGSRRHTGEQSVNSSGGGKAKKTKRKKTNHLWNYNELRFYTEERRLWSPAGRRAELWNCNCLNTRSPRWSRLSKLHLSATLNGENTSSLYVFNCEYGKHLYFTAAQSLRTTLRER